MSSSSGHTQGKAEPAGWGVAGCQAGASTVSLGLRSISVPGAPVLGAGSRRHHPPWGLNSPLRGSMGQPPDLHPCELG